MSFLEVDGSVLEGGGQILRIAAALSVILKREIRITKIRASRPNPGLRSQHLKGLQVLAELSRGKLRKALLNSTEVYFIPETIRGGEYRADTGTAGSVTLLAQISLPCALFSNCTTTFHFRGGTNTDMAPQLDFFTEVFRPILERFGATFDYRLVRRGYFPKGGGEVSFRVHPIKHLYPVVLCDQGRLQKIWGWAFVAGTLSVKMAEEAADAAVSVFRKKFGYNIAISINAYKENPDEALGNGFGITLVAQTTSHALLSGSALHSRGKTPESVGLEAANELLEDIRSGGCVDKYAQDQIIIFMALAKGVSRVRVGKITEHTRTAIYVCELMTEARFKIETSDTDTNIIECSGIGLVNNQLPTIGFGKS